jgi:hypothetical protein
VVVARAVVDTVAVALVVELLSETELVERLQDGAYDEFAPDGELVNEHERETVPESLEVVLTATVEAAELPLDMAEVEVAESEYVDCVTVTLVVPLLLA